MSHSLFFLRSFMVSGLTLRCFELIFVYNARYGLTFLNMRISNFSSIIFWKDYLSSNDFYSFVKNQLTFYALVSQFPAIPLHYVLKPASYHLGHCGFMMSGEVRQRESQNLSLFRLVWSILPLLQFQVKFRSSVSIFTKSLLGFCQELHWIYTSVWEESVWLNLPIYEYGVFCLLRSLISPSYVF